LKQTAYEKTMQMPLSFMAHGSKHKWAACIWMCLFCVCVCVGVLHDTLRIPEDTVEVRTIYIYIYIIITFTIHATTRLNF